MIYIPTFCLELKEQPIGDTDFSTLLSCFSWPPSWMCRTWEPGILCPPWFCSRSWNEPLQFVSAGSTPCNLALEGIPLNSAGSCAWRRIACNAAIPFSSCGMLIYYRVHREGILMYVAGQWWRLGCWSVQEVKSVTDLFWIDRANASLAKLYPPFFYLASAFL